MNKNQALNSQKELDLENHPGLLDFLNKLRNDSGADFEHFNLIYKCLVSRAESSIAPISKAQYSALLIYESKDQLQIYSGANIDPAEKYQFQIPEYRNCAEKQAALAASLLDNINLDKLLYVFLYRKSSPGVTLSPEQLTPCKECNKDFITKLINNQGKLFLVTDDKISRIFVQENFANNTKLTQTHSSPNYIYTSISGEALKYLVTEKALGKRVLSSSED